MPKEKKNISVVQAVVSVVSILIVIGGITTTVAVAIAQGQYIDEVQNKEIKRLENKDLALDKHDKEHDLKAQEDQKEILTILHKIELDLKDKKDR